MMKTNLTKNQALVMDELAKSDGPLSAYMILDNLREHGFRAPLQVYRALEKLVDNGMVHRLDSLNSFIACNHPSCSKHERIAFAICRDCGRVDELTDASLSEQLNVLTKANGFQLEGSTIELRGLCNTCCQAS